MNSRQFFHATLLSLAVSATAFFSGCTPIDTPTVAATTAATTTLSAGQVTTTVKGVILDGLGNPIEGVEVGYSDGSNPAISTSNASSRSIQNITTNNKGMFELQYLSQTANSAGALGGDVWVSLKKDGYTGRRIKVTIPTLSTVAGQKVTILCSDNTTKEITIGVSQTVEVDLSNNGSAATGTKTYITNKIGGFHIASDLGATTILKLGAEVKGSLKLKNNDADAQATAYLPPEGSIIALNLPSDFSPYVFTAIVDAEGNFVFGADGKDSNGKANPLPIFGANASSSS